MIKGKKGIMAAIKESLEDLSIADLEDVYIFIRDKIDEELEEAGK